MTKNILSLLRLFYRKTVDNVVYMCYYIYDFKKEKTKMSHYQREKLLTEQIVKYNGYTFIFTRKTDGKTITIEELRQTINIDFEDNKDEIMGMSKLLYALISQGFFKTEDQKVITPEEEKKLKDFSNLLKILQKNL